jgi:hypothetical protein
MDEVLNDDQRRRPVVELFALVHADVNAHLSAALTDTLGLGPGLSRLNFSVFRGFRGSGAPNQIRGVAGGAAVPCKNRAN